MIHVDEEDPIGEVELSFPYRDVTFRRNVDPKEIYDLQLEIGRGKFGTVYKCKEKQTGLHLAAKFITVPKKEDRRNVEREVEIMRQLQHPRLIQVYDAFENGKTMTVILELIEGGELFERVIDDDFVLTEKSCAIFMRQICEGIDFIHKQNIVHLDMKPENILCLTKTGNRIKIIDFGLARKYDPDKKLQVLFGTPEFVAPEVVNFDQIGFGTDMWSVGVICYVLLSGLSPFMGHTDVETMANVTIAKYDFDDDAFQEISEHAIDFIRKLLLKDVKQRLSAHQCLNHVWLKRPLPQPQVINTEPKNRHNSMDMAKDNLRQFVERWSEHPNSPYVFELTSHTILPTNLRYNSGLLGSQESLVGLSPSPCGSLASSPGSDFADYPFLTLTSQMDFRRASDSSCIVKTPDITERVNLAEEIKKLSDKLFQLSTLPTIPINEPIINNGFDSSNITKSKEVKIRNGHSNQTSSSVNIPWRKPKFKLTSMNRDVPMAKSPPSCHRSMSFRDHFQSKLSHFKEECISQSGFVNNERKVIVTRKSTTNNSPNDTKDMLLQLLGQWEGPAKVSVKRHGSISTEWSDTESLGQRTISSLNTFFQSRSNNKKMTHFHKN